MAAMTRKQVEDMVGSSRTRDKKYKRKYEAGTFITTQRIKDMACMQNDKCFYCGDGFNYDVASRTHRDGCTLERVDEKEAHTIENCILVCAYCNNARGHKTYEEMLEKAADMKSGAIKYCSDCDTWFSREENAFSKNKASHDGLQNICRQCAIARFKAYRAAKKKIAH
jgi:5-methylcytosine-specific restriction endonuclease McrA